jgi:hypothetical protein
MSQIGDGNAMSYKKSKKSKAKAPKSKAIRGEKGKNSLTNGKMIIYF